MQMNVQMNVQMNMQKPHSPLIGLHIVEWKATREYTLLQFEGE